MNVAVQSELARRQAATPPNAQGQVLITVGGNRITAGDFLFEPFSHLSD